MLMASEDFLGGLRIFGRLGVGRCDDLVARKGVFLTTAGFTKEARGYVENIEKRIVPIDGPQLAGLMFDFEIGANPERSYPVKRIDGDYFEE